MRVVLCPACVSGIGQPSEPHPEVGTTTRTTTQRIISIVQSKQVHIHFFGPALWASPGASCSDVWLSGYQRELNFAVLESHRPHDHLRDLTQSPVSSTQSRLLRLRQIAGDRNLDPGQHI